MKFSVPNLILIFALISLPLIGKTVKRDCTIILEPKWQNLENNKQKNKIFGGKWILAGSITFRKKSKDTVYLSKLIFRWKGKKIDNLLGSLYKKNLDKKFLPIEDSLICDSYWNKKKQTLIFNFKKQVSLGPTSIFYLVLTVPDKLENTLKQGSFFIESHCLPTPFKMAARHQTLILTFSSRSRNISCTAVC